MYARSTSLRARPQSVDDGIAEVRDQVVPAIQEMDGFAGHSMLVDRDSGRCIVTTAWHDNRALVQSREKVLELRRHAAETLGDSNPEVREWEIATLHRERPVPDGACARITWLRGPTERADREVEVFKEKVLPRLQDLAGFCSASLFIDRSEGRAVGAFVYESREALAATREVTQQIRHEAVQETDAYVQEVAEFEVLMAHLRVPELV